MKTMHEEIVIEIKKLEYKYLCAIYLFFLIILITNHLFVFLYCIKFISMKKINKTYLWIPFWWAIMNCWTRKFSIVLRSFWQLRVASHLHQNNKQNWLFFNRYIIICWNSWNNNLQLRCSGFLFKKIGLSIRACAFTIFKSTWKRLCKFMTTPRS